MNSNETSNNPPADKKRRSTSFPLIFGTVLAGFVAYYFDAGPKLMTYVMYLQEQAKVNAQTELARKEKLEKKDPNSPADPGGMPAFRDPPGYDNSNEPGATPAPDDAPGTAAPTAAPTAGTPAAGTPAK